MLSALMALVACMCTLFFTFYDHNRPSFPCSTHADLPSFVSDKYLVLFDPSCKVRTTSIVGVALSSVDQLFIPSSTECSARSPAHC